jgi:hypothetical protein
MTVILTVYLFAVGATIWQFLYFTPLKTPFNRAAYAAFLTSGLFLL